MSLSPAEMEALLLSLRVAVVSVLVGLPVAYGLALLLARRRGGLWLALDVLVHVPLVVPPVVVGWGLLVLLGRQGPLGRWLDEAFGIGLPFTWEGAALAALVMALPLMVRAIRSSLEAQDPALVPVARSLGQGPWRSFLRVTLPLSMPGVLAGAVLGFARALGEFGATITFAASIPGETRTLPLALYGALQVPGGEAQAARYAVLSILLAVAALVISEILARRGAPR